MKEVTIISIIVLQSFFMLFISVIIFTKKKLYYEYIDRTKKITLTDYVTRFDGNWLFKNIDYKLLLKENPNDKKLVETIKLIKNLNAISIVLMASSLLPMIYLKFCGEI